MVRVWFSTWFSSIYRVIEDLKKNPDNIEFYIIGTNTNYEASYKVICDEWYEEIKTSDINKYIDWALNFCQKHKIDIFIPRKNIIEIAYRKEEFLRIGTKVMVENDKKLIQILSNKKDTMEYFEKNKLCKVADYEIVDYPQEFEEKYKLLKQRNPNEKICMKYVTGEGGTSFRIIEEEIEDILSLSRSYNLKINYEQVLKMVNNSKKFIPIMLMIYLEGIEISIDCLQIENNLVAIPRYKAGIRRETIKFDNKIISVVEKFNNIAKLQYPFNIQFIYYNNELYLLEVNTRMSGGLYLSNKLGYDILYNAICKIINLPTKSLYKKKQIDIGYIEEGIRLR